MHADGVSSDRSNAWMFLVQHVPAPLIWRSEKVRSQTAPNTQSACPSKQISSSILALKPIFLLTKNKFYLIKGKKLNYLFQNVSVVNIFQAFMLSAQERHL
jgi:hypothetical protein